MSNPQASPGRPATHPGQPGPRTVTRSVALPRSGPELLELRDLLKANLHALHALHEEHRRMLGMLLRTLGGASAELRRELHAIGDAGAPWVKALSETRALLFVALRELIVGAPEGAPAAKQSALLPEPASADPPAATSPASR